MVGRVGEENWDGEEKQKSLPQPRLYTIQRTLGPEQPINAQPEPYALKHHQSHSPVFKTQPSIQYSPYQSLDQNSIRFLNRIAHSIRNAVNEQPHRNIQNIPQTNLNQD